MITWILKKGNNSETATILYEKGVVKNFAKFTAKQLCQSVFFNKAIGFLRC